MTGPDPDPQPAPDLTPAQERAVRALLADARHEGPPPADVRARLDATLADLVAERGEAPGATSAAPAAPAAEPSPSRPPAPVVPLARRRRRIAAASLVAAAAVVVAGVTVGQLVGGGAGDSGSASLAEDSSAGEQELAQPLKKPRPRRSRTTAREDVTTDEAKPPTPALGSATLRRDVRALAPVAAAGGTLRDRAAPCRVGRAGPGDRVRATYDGQDGLLVFRAPTGGVQRVDLYLCGSEGVARTVILHRR